MCVIVWVCGVTWLPPAKSALSYLVFCAKSANVCGVGLLSLEPLDVVPLLVNKFNGSDSVVPSEGVVGPFWSF
jgi:hypothetical protein